MQAPIRLMAFCSSTAEWFTIDGVLEGGRMIWRHAKRVPSNEVQQAKAMWQGPALGHVTIDASAFQCPCCGGTNRVAQFLLCQQCEVFMCSGIGPENRIKGPCGRCSWTREQIGPPRETFPSKAAIRM